MAGPVRRRWGIMPLPLLPSHRRFRGSRSARGIAGRRRELEFGAGHQQDRLSRGPRGAPLPGACRSPAESMSTTGAGWRWGESLDPTGDTKRRRDSHSLTATIYHAFSGPGLPRQGGAAAHHAGSALPGGGAVPEDFPPESRASPSSTNWSGMPRCRWTPRCATSSWGCGIRYLDRRSFVGQRGGIHADATQCLRSVCADFRAPLERGRPKVVPSSHVCARGFGALFPDGRHGHMTRDRRLRA